jgi:hypothetical protein
VSEVIDFIFIEQRDLIALFGLLDRSLQVSIQLPIQLDGIPIWRSTVEPTKIGLEKS